MSRILYAEDEPFLGKIVKESLESRGYHVHMVSQGDEVLPAYVAFEPQLCVLDVMLPKRDGFSIGAELRQRHPHVPIIYLTAKTQTEDLLKGFQAGGNDYIRKPFSMEELIARIDNLLQLAGQQSVPEQGTPVSLGEFTFYPDRLQLAHPEHGRKLSHRETQLLQLLTAQLGQPVPRKDLLMAIWGDDSFFNSRNLDVYVTRLRGYLRAEPRVEIMTLKGFGYQVLVGEST